jgi:hypothetical protein
MWVAFAAPIALSVLFGSVRNDGVQRRLASRPVAFRAEAATAPALAAATTATPAAEATPAESGLLGRAIAALDALESTLDRDSAAPDAARADLRATATRLRVAATELAARMEQLERAAVSPLADDDLGPLRQRQARLQTLQRAGDPVDDAEIARNDAALARQAGEQAEAERLEAEAVACRAQLVEITSAASRAQRELVGGAHHSADAAVRQLRAEAEAMARARRELGQRA